MLSRSSSAFGWICVGAILATIAIYSFQLFSSAFQPSADGDSFAVSGHSPDRYRDYLALQEKNKYWADRIIEGGYILHFRHAQREKWRDAAAFDAYELHAGINPLEIESSQYRATCLTRRGIEEAQLIKKILEIAGVQVSQVLSSPSCRAWMTAQYAFGQDYEIENSLLNRTAIIPEQHAEFDQRLRDVLMSIDIEPGSNVALTGHGATLAFSGESIINEVRPDAVKDREETGIYVIERKEDRLILHYTFTSIKELANVVVRVPLNSSN